MTKRYVGFPDCSPGEFEESLEASVFWDAHGEYGVDSADYIRFVEGVSYGAGWAFAIVGMFTAIREARLESAIATVLDAKRQSPQPDGSICECCSSMCDVLLPTTVPTARR